MLDKFTIQKKGEVFPVISDGDLNIEMEVKHTGEIFFHIKPEIMRFTPSLYKRLLKHIGAIQQELIKLGVNKAYVLVPANQPKLIKFEQLCGFVPETIYTTVTKDSYLLLSRTFS